MSYSEDIDALLTTYLNLLDTYTTLRTQLATLSSTTNQHLARANFASDRGRRYGKDDYDERMQSNKRVTIESQDTNGTRIRFGVAHVEERDPKSEAKTRKTEEHKSQEDGEMTQKEDEPKPSPYDGNPSKSHDLPAPPKKHRNDPLRQFGILVPQALRQAQESSLKMVQDIIPQLVSVDVEMKEIEIQIRRARKYAKKAEGKTNKAEPLDGGVKEEGLAT